MKALKLLFVQRFSAFDALVIGGIAALNLEWWVLVLIIPVWSLISITCERMLNISEANGNTSWSKL